MRRSRRSACAIRSCSTFCSLSALTMVYKGQLISTQMPEFFPDLHRSRIEDRTRDGPSALLHQHVPELGPRASVSLHRRTTARSTRCAATSTGCMRARSCSRRRCSATTSRSCFRSSSRTAATPRCSTMRSSCSIRTGRSLPHAVMMMIPEAWQNDPQMSDEQARVLRVPLLHDGAVGRSRLDRVHRRHAHRRGARSQRPASLALLRDQGRPRRDGVGDRRPRHRRRRTSRSKGRLQPGKMFLVDTELGRIVQDEEIKSGSRARQPYRAVARSKASSRSTACPSRRRRRQSINTRTTSCSSGSRRSATPSKI